MLKWDHKCWLCFCGTRCLVQLIEVLQSCFLQLTWVQPWLHWSVLMSPGLPHLRPEATAFACGPRNPFQLCPAPSVPCWANFRGAVRTSCFLKDEYNDWLGGQRFNEGPEVIASEIPQFYPEKNDETRNLESCYRRWRVMHSINSNFFPCPLK